jgi:glutamyl/glutaminyl-tRNA synthetase
LTNKIEKLVEDAETSQLKDAIFKFCKEENMGMGIVMQTLRIAIVGTLSGPDILGVINVIGKKSTLGRLKQLRNHNLN